jgi:cytochrome bd-type quinol oxidase subunit 2
VPALIFAVIALVGAAVSTRRHRGESRLAVDTLMVWWLVVAVGVAGIVGALFHIFDGKQIAEQIGYTRGDGGFQFENAMGDMAIGVAAVLARWFRGYYWLAVVIVLSIQYLGDAGGHVYFWLAEGNTEPDNVGIPLWFDFILPIVSIALYAISWRRGGDARPPGAAPATSAGPV